MRLTPKIVIAGAVAIIGLGGLGFYGVQLHARSAKFSAMASPAKRITNNGSPIAKAKRQSGNTPTPTTTPSPASPTPAPAKSSSPVTTPAPAQIPAPIVNTVNCLPPNPSKYATYYTHMTNSQYLQSDGYVTTDKLYAALQFAGLIDTINTKQYVVLAMDDSQWGNLTQAQLDWMNASPANMRSVLGWQVITSCITWDGVNPVENMAAGATRTVSTLNGPVTFTAQANGTLGTFDSASVAIWDWFTSNGSVTIAAGFVSPPQVP